MKNIYFTLIIAVTLLTSCVIESYEKPKKTIIGYNLSEHVSSNIRTVSLIADITRIADMWRSAATQQEKHGIEDKYFDNDIRIREYGDMITIVGYYDFNTFGKSLSESKWKVTPLNTEIAANLMYEVSLTGTNENLINILNSSNEPLGALTLKIITPNKEYSILGSSTIAPISTTTHYDKITYSITTPVDFIFNGSELSFWRWQPYLRQQNGCIDIKVYKSGIELNQDKTTAKYAPLGVEISYRGLKDFHTYPEY